MTALREHIARYCRHLILGEEEPDTVVIKVIGTTTICQGYVLFITATHQKCNDNWRRGR